MSARRVFALKCALFAMISAFVITVALSVQVNVWNRYGGWGWSIGHGCSGIGYIHQGSPQFQQDSGWFTDLCE